MVQLGLVGRLIDQRVGILIGAERVEIDLLVGVERLEGLPLARRREAAVVEAAAVLRPVEIGELHPFDRIGQHCAGGDIHHLDRAPVAAAILDRVEQLAAIIGDRIIGERGGIVFRPFIGVDQHARLPIQPVAHVEDALVLQPVIAGVEVVAALIGRQAEAFVIGQLGDPLLQHLAPRQAGEEGGHFLIGADVVFQPAIGIGHLLPEVLFHDIAGARFGIVGRGQILRGGGHRDRNQCGGGSGKKAVAKHGVASSRWSGKLVQDI